MGQHFPVYGDGDQALAAEPDFRGAAPCGVDAAAILLPHLLQCGIRAASDPLESGVSSPLTKV